ncbi:PQ loop repeat-domain-containing protein [Daedaleopsis nitida]|nr:PQ loop repeat-domain-containing protein [Daedaleopsis nitida]
MVVSHAAENVLGTMGTICWTIQLLPQLWHTYRTKSVEGLSKWLMLTWGIAGSFLGVYSVVQGLSIPLILQPQLFGILCLVSWAQWQYYGNGRSRVAAIAMFVGAVALFAGFEVGMIFAVKPSYNAGNLAPVLFLGVLSATLIAGALLPQYYEIYKYKEVIGISVPFMTVDLSGGVFNVLSLVFKGEFDVLAGTTYALVVVLDGVVVLCALVLNPLARRRRPRLAAAEGGLLPSETATIHNSNDIQQTMTGDKKAVEEKRDIEQGSA